MFFVVRCPICSARLANLKNLKSHISSKHRNTRLDITGLQEVDQVNEYAKMIITVGLIKNVMDAAIQHGNGHCLITIYKLLAVWCKAVGFNHYAKGLSELQYQLQSLPSPIAKSITWNRFVNNKGKNDTNVPMDLDIEHANKHLKAELKTYRGDYTECHLGRISKGLNARKEIEKNFDVSTKGYTKVSKRRDGQFSEDIATLTEHLSKHNIWLKKPGRSITKCDASHTSLLVDHNKHCTWLKQQIKVWDSKPYYRRFNSELADDMQVISP